MKKTLIYLAAGIAAGYFGSTQLRSAVPQVFDKAYSALQGS